MLWVACLFWAMGHGSGQVVMDSTILASLDDQLQAVTSDGKFAWKWKYNVRESCKDQTVAEGAIVATAHGKKEDAVYAVIECGPSMLEKNSTAVLFALTSGKVQWELAVTCPRKRAACFSALSVDESGVIYFTTHGGETSHHFQKIPGKISALKADGTHLWSTPVAADGLPPSLGKNASEGLLFALGHDGLLLEALTKADGFIKWSAPIHGPWIPSRHGFLADKSAMQLEVAADGTLLMLSRLGMSPTTPTTQGGCTLSAYSETGRSLWTHTLWNRSGSDGWLDTASMSMGADGTIYVNLNPQFETSQLLAFAANGQKRWALTHSNHQDKIGTPSKQDSKGNVIITSYNSAQALLSILVVKPDGSSSTFADIHDQSDPRFLDRDFPGRPLLMSDGSLCLSDPYPDSEPNGALRVYSPNGDKRLQVNSTLNFQPVPAPDGTAYIKRCHYWNLGCDTYSLLAIDTKAASPKWEYVFNEKTVMGSILV